MSEVCGHGSLKRKCEICERDERIAELERCIRRMLRESDKARECLGGPRVSRKVKNKVKIEKATVIYGP